MTANTLDDLTVTTPINADITGNAATATTAATAAMATNVVTNANLTGPITSSGNATSIASQTGTGTKFVVDTSPTIITPNISIINAPTTAGTTIQGRTDGGSVAAGYVGEVLSFYQPNTNAIALKTSPVTITIASPGLVTYTSHGLATGSSLYLTTTGALPTGLTVNTNYYVVVNDSNSFWLAASVSNAFSGTKINTSGSQSGTHTANIGLLLAYNVATDLLGLSLTPGVWSVTMQAQQFVSGTPTLNGIVVGISSASGTFQVGPGLYYDANDLSYTAPVVGMGRSSGPRIFSISANTVIYGVVRLVWTGGTSPVANAFGGLQAVRIA